MTRHVGLGYQQPGALRKRVCSHSAANENTPQLRRYSAQIAAKAKRRKEEESCRREA